MHRAVALVVVALAVALAVGYRMWTAEPAAEVKTAPIEETSPEPAAPRPVATSPESSAPAEPPARTGTAEVEDLTRVEGVVVEHGSARPVANAVISAYERDDRDDILAEVTAGQDGAFSLDVDLGDRTYVKCNAPGFAETHVRVESSGTRLRIAMRRAGVIVGRVLDAQSNAPIAGVMVQASVRSELGSMMRDADRATRSRSRGEASTDHQGEYTIDGLPSGAYTLAADGQSLGYLPADGAPPIVNVEAGSQYEALDIRLRRGGFVYGVAKDNRGNPVTDVDFHVLRDSRGDFSDMFQSMQRRLGASVDVADDGSFRIGAFEYGTEYRIQGNAEAFAPQIQTVTMPPDRDAGPVRFVFSPGANVSGVAWFENGEPAGDVRLVLRPEGTGPFDFEAALTEMVKTNEDGTFGIEHVPDGLYRLASVRARDFGGASGMTVEVVDERDVSGIELMLTAEPNESAEPITGSVVDESGNPVVGILVTVAEMGDIASDMTATDADGRFSLAAAPMFGGGLVLEASGDAGYKRLTGVQPGSAVRMRLEPSARVSGTVVNARGEPVADCAVSLESGEDGFMNFMPSSSNGETVLTGEDGRFEIANMKPGTYFAQARSEMQGTGKTDKFDADLGRPVDNLRIILEPGARLSGRVYDPDGRPLPRAQVRAVPSAGGMFAAMADMMPEEFTGSSGAATTDDRGEFTIPNVPPGTYSIVATHPEYAKASISDVAVASGEHLQGIDLTMSMGGGASGVYMVDGRPMPGVTIQLVGSGGMRMVTTDAEGRFDVSGIPAGRYQLIVLDFDDIDPSAGMAALSDIFGDTVDIVDGAVTPVDLSPRVGVSVSGSLAALGLGEGAMIRLRTPDGVSLNQIDLADPLTTGLDMISSSGGFGDVNADGSFVVENVEPGEYVLEVYQEPDPSAFVSTGDFSADAIQAFMPVLVHSQGITVGSEPIAVEIGAQPAVN